MFGRLVIAMVFAAVALVGGGSVALAGSASPIALDPPCPDSYFLGAAGSGESTDPTDANLGMGPVVHSAYAQFRTAVGTSRSVEAHSLGYAAANPITLLGAPGVYFDSISVGVRLAQSQIGAVRGSCPTEDIVLAGYSQGAMVMHRVIQDLVSSGDTGTLDRIGGVILIGDADRLPGDNTTNWGGATPGGRGIGQFETAISGSRAAPLFPADLTARVESVCGLMDPVCDVPQLTVGRYAAQWMVSGRTHFAYPGTAALTRAVNHLVAGLPPPSPPPAYGDFSPATLPHARVGIPYTQAISCNFNVGAYNCSVQIDNYPPGLSTGGTSSDSLLVQGTPTQAGTFTFTVTGTYLSDARSQTHTLIVDP